MAIWSTYFGHLVYFAAIWYVYIFYGFFGFFPPVLVCFTKKNLATLCLGVEFALILVFQAEMTLELTKNSRLFWFRHNQKSR
jgi:hypothetical protein